MDKLITLCRDVEGTAPVDCIEDHEGLDGPLIAPCKVMTDPYDRIYDRTIEADHVGPEAESSATFQDMMRIRDCCDC
jgi:hypothetical protein